MSWKTYKNAYTPKTHYYCDGSLKNYKFLQVKVIEQPIAGTNQKDIHHSEKCYSIELTDGYKSLKLDFYSEGLVNSKKKAIEMLNNFKNKAA